MSPLKTSQEKHSPISEAGIVIRRSSQPDERRSRYTIYVSWIIIPVVFLFPLVNDYSGALVNVILTVIGAIVIANLILYRTSWTPVQRLIPVVGVTIATGTILYFVYIGYADGSSVMWMFIYPLLVMFMLGIIWGITSSLTMLSVATWIMLSGDSIGSYDYSVEFIKRFVVSYLMVTAMVLAYEYWRVLLEIQKERIDLELQGAREALAGFANVCAWCNSVKSADGSWQSLEEYVSKQEEQQVSHSICPGCAKAQIPQ